MVGALFALLVAAAANTRPALEALKPEMARAAGENVEIRYGATGSFARQIENGAPYDLLFAADEGTIDRLSKDGLVDPSSVSPYAVGTLVLVVAKDAPFRAPRRLDGATASAFAKLPFRKLAVASPKIAPYGGAAEQVLRATDIFDDVKDRIVYAENVEQALTFVATGNAEAGFVAASQAAGAGLQAIGIDPTLYEPLRQVAGVVVASTKKGAARRALGAVLTPSARETWHRFGYRDP